MTADLDRLVRFDDDSLIRSANHLVIQLVCSFDETSFTWSYKHHSTTAPYHSLFHHVTDHSNINLLLSRVSEETGRKIPQCSPRPDERELSSFHRQT
jgi:hypothetical protein